ncbi:hypothetical protein SSX86_025092 [Deinandra increscens subsp. villosa]|uniref:Uncharacterized protein n=1 Tax=Deinandra increscens subsp. villosa TaxID=3103831 RepID=A0AAP0GLQ5_9ASTR
MPIANVGDIEMFQAMASLREQPAEVTKIPVILDIGEKIHCSVLDLGEGDSSILLGDALIDILHNVVESSRPVNKRLVKLRCDESGYNTYASQGEWDDAKMLKKAMNDKKAASSLLNKLELTFKFKKKKMMNEKMKALMIGVVGAGITLSAYSQTYMSSTQCIGTGFFVLVIGLLVGEGFLPI